MISDLHVDQILRMFLPVSVSSVFSRMLPPQARNRNVTHVWAPSQRLVVSCDEWRRVGWIYRIRSTVCSLSKFWTLWGLHQKQVRYAYINLRSATHGMNIWMVNTPINIVRTYWNCKSQEDYTINRWRCLELTESTFLQNNSSDILEIMLIFGFGFGFCYTNLM